MDANANRGPAITTVTIIFLALSWIVVSARYYVRIFLTKNFYLDDGLAGLCLILFTAYGGVGIAGVYWGAGRHIYTIPPANIKASMKVWYFCEIAYAVTSCVLRLTVGIFFLRLVTRRIHRIIIITLNTIGVTFGVIYLVIIIFQCMPLSYFWERIDAKMVGACQNGNFQVKMTIAATVIAAVTDWSFALLPIWLMWNLRVTRQKKIVVCFLLGLSALASAAPIIRLSHLPGLMDNIDFLWATTDVAIWSVVELGVGLIVISLPSCRALVRSIPFFAAMADRTPTGSDQSPHPQGSRSKSTWANQRTKKKVTDPLDSVESSNDGHSQADLMTSLSDSATLKDVEKVAMRH